jgi:hypothetical protein
MESGRNRKETKVRKMDKRSVKCGNRPVQVQRGKRSEL